MTDIALKAQEDLLSFDVSDDALEIAASAARIGASFTLGSCTGLSAPVDPLRCISRHFGETATRVCCCMAGLCVCAARHVAGITGRYRAWRGAC
jgi:hypothetical protein